MRRAALPALLVLLGLLVAACASPAGMHVEECNTSWRGLESRIVSGGSGERQAVPIACMLRIDERRVIIGFEMPPGPDCYELSAVELEESADVAAVTLIVARQDNVGGTCPTEPTRTVTEVDFQSPIGDRALLDGSR